MMFPDRIYDLISMREAVASMPVYPYQEIIRMRFQNRNTLEAIGRTYGCGRERVRQILDKSLRYIRAHMFGGIKVSLHSGEPKRGPRKKTREQKEAQIRRDWVEKVRKDIQPCPRARIRFVTRRSGWETTEIFVDCPVPLLPRDQPSQIGLPRVSRKRCPSCSIRMNHRWEEMIDPSTRQQFKTRVLYWCPKCYRTEAKEMPL